MPTADAERISIDLGVELDTVVMLVREGLTTDEIYALLTQPLTVIEWSTETTVAGDVTLDEDGSGTRQGLLPPVRGKGSIETTHKGSTFSRESARLTMRTDFRWDKLALVSTRVVEHRVATTAWGGIGGWRVEPSHEGSSGWISEPFEYRAEVKADWKVVAIVKPVEVQSGTAWIQHTVTGLGTSRADQGGWP